MKWLVIVTALMIFLFGIIYFNPIKEVVSESRLAASLNCADASVSDGTKLTCLGIDFVVPMFIIVIFSVAGGAIVNLFR